MIMNFPQVSDAGSQEVIAIDRRESEEHTIEMTPNAVYGTNMRS